MSTSVTRVGANLPSGNFLPDVFSKKLQAKYYASTTLWDVANRNWEGEIKGQGAKVIIRVRPSITTGAYTVNGTINYQDLADDKIELLVDKARYAAFKVDDIDKAQADINIINEASTDMAENMKIDIEKEVFGTVYASAGNSITSQQVTAANVLAWILTAGERLDEDNVPVEGRWLIIPPWIRTLLLQSDIKAAYLTGDQTSPLRNGKLGMIDRFMVYVSNNLSGIDTVGGPRYCLAGHKDGISFASQITKTEPLRLQNTFGDAIRALNVYGFKVTKDVALVSMPAYK